MSWRALASRLRALFPRRHRCFPRPVVRLDPARLEPECKWEYVYITSRQQKMMDRALRRSVRLIHAGEKRSPAIHDCGK